MLPQTVVTELARRLYEARKSRTQLRHFSRAHPQMSIEDGYAIQRAWVALELADGHTIMGRKIGLTSRAMQQASQITEPDYAPLMSDMFFETGADILCSGRVVRFNDSVDLGRIGLAAARLAGSGIGIGLQGKGTALIHRRDLAPLANLELYSVAPSVTAELYRLLGANAARHAKGGTPDPARNPYSDEAIEARYHTTVIALMELERRRMVPGAPPEELSLEGLT